MVLDDQNGMTAAQFWFSRRVRRVILLWGAWGRNSVHQSEEETGSSSHLSSFMDVGVLRSYADDRN
jgi:hypothetical protein